MASDRTTSPEGQTLLHQRAFQLARSGCHESRTSELVRAARWRSEMQNLGSPPDGMEQEVRDFWPNISMADSLSKFVPLH